MSREALSPGSTPTVELGMQRWHSSLSIKTPRSILSLAIGSRVKAKGGDLMADSAAAPFDPRALAAKLHGLRRSRNQAPTAGFSLPADLRHAMDAQNFLAADEAIESNAWKVTVSPDGQAVTAPLHPYVQADSGAQIPWQ